MSLRHAGFSSLLIATLLCLAPGCQSKPSKPKGKGAPQVGAIAPKPGVKPPKELIASFALRAPGKTLDEALALAERFTRVPLSKRGLLDLLLQRARLPRELLDTLDLNGVFWLLRFDDTTLGEREAMLVALPLRSKDRFQQLLRTRMDDKGADGELRIYRPKKGQLGLTETRLWVGPRWAVVPTSRKVFDRAKEHLRGVLLHETPKHDVELVVLMENLMRGVGKKLEQSLDTAMAQLKSTASKQAAARGRPMDPAQLTSSIERLARRYYALAKSATTLRLALDVHKGSLKLRGVIADNRGGALAKLLKVQRPGSPFGAGLLPKQTYGLFANRGRALVQSDASPLDVALNSISSAMPSPFREQFVAALKNTRKHFGDDLTVGVFRPAPKTGVTIAMVSRVLDAKKATNAIEQAVKVAIAWMGAEAQKAGKSGPAAMLKPSSRPFTVGEVQGNLLELTLPAETMKTRQSLDALLGPKLTLGWFLIKDVAVLAVGKDAEEQLKSIAVAANKDGGKGKLDESLLDAPAFRAALASRDVEPMGLVYLSLIDLVQGLEGLGIDAATPLIADLKGKKAGHAPALVWGVDGKRQELVLELTLPSEHFVHFKGFLSALQRPGRPRIMLPPPRNN